MKPVSFGGHRVVCVVASPLPPSLLAASTKSFAMMMQMAVMMAMVDAPHRLEISTSVVNCEAERRQRYSRGEELRLRWQQSVSQRLATALKR